MLNLETLVGCSQKAYGQTFYLAYFLELTRAISYIGMYTVTSIIILKNNTLECALLLSLSE